MTAAQILGVVLIVLPFVALGIYAVRELGWGAFAFVFGGSLVVTMATIGVGSFLLVGP